MSPDLQHDPVVTKQSALDLQVCVPATWTDEEVKTFADKERCCGTEHGWEITRQGDPALNGDSERVFCQGRTGFVHLMLHA